MFTPSVRHRRDAGDIGLAARPETIASRVRQALAELGADFAAMAGLASLLRLTESQLYAAVEPVPYLGVCGTSDAPLLYCLPAGALAAGFVPELRDGQLVLRLPARGHRPALLISGQLVGRVPRAERDQVLGAGSLAYVVHRLTAMAHSWLTPTPDPTRRLFELIAQAWHRGPIPLRPAALVRVHRAAFDRSTATGNATGNAAASNCLELVVNYRDSEYHLLNLYPLPARGDEFMTWDDRTLRRIGLGVFAVRGRSGPIGTATVITNGIALTALHVIAPEQPNHLRLCDPTQPASAGLAVRAATTLPLNGYGPERELAQRSMHRARYLTGTFDTTVDLALLSVPELRAPGLPIRTTPVRDGELVMVPGYPRGQRSITQGPIVGHDNADFTIHALLGPGASGAPVIDQHGGLTGIVTLDTETGTICIGPQLLITLIRRLRTGPARGR